MSDLELRIRNALPQRLDAFPLRPDRLAELSLSEIERLSLRFEDGTSIAVGEMFVVSGKPSNELHVIGDATQLDDLGAHMEQGHLTIEGTVGQRLGEQMAGGRIVVRGDAGHLVGRAMRGGSIVVHGSVGHGAGSGVPGAKKGMRGGEIVVFGNAGSETGACMRRGIIAVAGNVGPHALRSALAGTVISFGNVAEAAGRWSKRASLITMADVTIPAGYEYACTFQPGFVRVLLAHLRQTYSFPVSPEHMEQAFERYCGDFAELGRGEILRAVKG
jgi:formylmethanofuran dehydrogenase subunit C